MNDFEVEISPASPMGASFDPYLPSLSNDHIGSEIIHISDDSYSEGGSRDSSREETLSFGSLYALISNVGGEINCIEVPMPHCFLSEEGVRANLQIKEHARDYIQLCL